MNWMIVLLMGTVTALATGLGALPFAFVSEVRKQWISRANAAAAGLMLAASGTLVWESLRIDGMRSLVGLAVGMLFFVIVGRWTHTHSILELRGVERAAARKMILIMAVMTVHSFAEGMSVGVSFAGRQGLGLYIASAIALHNIPEGLAISLVMVPRGVAAYRAAGWSIFSSLPQPIVAVPAFLFVMLVRPALPLALGFAAGAMAWMVVSELVPDAREHERDDVAGVIAVLCALAMLAVAWWFSPV